MKNVSVRAMHCMHKSVFLICSSETYVLHAELSDGVVHQHCYILHTHPHTSVQPAALLWPVLTAFFLEPHANVQLFTPHKHSSVLKAKRCSTLYTC